MSSKFFRCGIVCLSPLASISPPLPTSRVVWWCKMSVKWMWNSRWPSRLETWTSEGERKGRGGISPDSNSVVSGEVCIERNWQWREAKQQLCIVGSSYQISCCLFFLAFLCEIPSEVVIMKICDFFDRFLMHSCVENAPRTRSLKAPRSWWRSQSSAFLATVIIERMSPRTRSFERTADLHNNNHFRSQVAL